MTFEEIRNAVNAAWRDYVVNGVPATGPNEPVKQEIRAALLKLTVAMENGGFSAPPNWAADLAEVQSKLEDVDAVVAGLGTVSAKALEAQAAASAAVAARDDAVAIYGSIEAVEAAATTATDAIDQMLEIASGAPDAPSILNKVNRNGSNVEADAFRGAIGTFATRAAAMAHNFVPGNKPSAIRLDGYASAGDGGGALYKPVAAEPTHAGKLQTSDGQWWELAEAVLTPQMFGSPGNLVGDDAPGLTAAFTLGRPVFLPQPAVGYQLLTPCTATLKAELELDFGGHTIIFKGGYIRLTGQTVVSDRTLASAAGRYATSVKLNSVAGLAAGDLLYIGTNVPAETGWNYTKKDLVKIRSIDPTTATVELDEPLNFAYATSDIGLTVSAARPQSVKLLRPNLKYDPALGNQAMIDLIDLQNVVVEEPSGSGAHAGFVPSSDESRRGIRLVRCWGGEVNKSVWDSLSYPIMVITGTRNVLVNGVSGRNCRHLVVPSDWPKTIIVRGLTGSDNFQSVESHPAFDVRYEAVSVERDASLSNLRCVGAMLRNANIHTLATNADFGPYFHSLIAANATAEYLYSDADLVLDNVWAWRGRRAS